jgi:hypothetical protein
MKGVPMKSEHELEELLRKAPAPPAPFGLEQRLIQQAGRPRRPEPHGWSWFAMLQERSWAPALALILIMAGLITVVAVQRGTLNELKQKQEALAADTQVQSEEPGRQEQALEREYRLLQKQSVELQALRTEMTEIDALLDQQSQLATENAALRAELSGLTPNNPEISPEVQEALAEAREKAGRIKCVNNLKNVGLGARIWATDNGDHLPKDFATMKNELNTPKILICPKDPARAEGIKDWEEFARIGGSYEMLSPGISEQFPGAVYVRCPFHNNVARADGSVMQLRPEQQLVQRNGYWEVAE